MNKKLQILQWLLLATLILSLLMVFRIAMQLQQTQQINAYISAPEGDVPDDSRARFAYAGYLVEKEENDTALNVLTDVIADSKHKAAVADAYFNRGNINLRHAMTLSVEDSKLIPLVELAKQDYRTALNLQSDMWDARYNLEVALQLVPEIPNPDAEFNKEDMGSQRSIETKGFRVDLP